MYMPIKSVTSISHQHDQPFQTQCPNAPLLYYIERQQMQTYSDSGTHSSAEVLDDEVDEPIYEPLQDRRAPGASVKQRKIPRAQKRKVDRIAKPVCLIERVSPASVLQYCHVIGKMEPDDVLDHLEYYWGISRDTLNLHTRYNICILGPRLHYLFDNKGHLFLPTLEILEQYRDHDIHTPLPYRPDDAGAQTRKFEYHMLVPPSMESVAIFRRKDENSKSTNAEDFEIYPFPYSEFPVIESHLLPHFVIYNAGKKLAEMDQRKEFIATNAHIDQVEQRADAALLLFYDWTKHRQFPPEWLLNSPLPTRSPPSHSSRAPTEPQRQSNDQQRQVQGNQSREGVGGLTILDEHSIKKLDRRSEREIYTDTRSSIDKWRVNVVTGLDVETPNEADAES
ncbi:hypothetical protein M413DRAFT_25508 [Hebeloma cylindrosporum]|uniref:HNH nuclease domain-containing protein n=1 Tax=Hebeloma cylindrosporum TaxID=76867 RepID=A0A0C3C585_HEBCY|nr:hypothetical protein M413DRAFT_25508 [Hebeloma cylindrosporum h7]